MRVLLLGGNGLLGHNVARQLLSQGHEVTALLRQAGSLRVAGGDAMNRVSTVVGSFLDFDTLLAAAQGHDAIINCAGCTDMSLLRLEDYLPCNRDGVQTICRVMEVLEISTLVHVSTANTIGYGSPSQEADESLPWQSPFRESFYAQSKRAGEEEVAALAQRHPDWHIITVNPGFMFGPHDYKPSSGQLLLAAYRKPVMLAPKGGKSFVPVEDAAAAIVNALTLGRHGEKYLLTGRNLTLKQFYRLQAQALGYRQLILTPPNWLLLLAARLGDLLRLFGLRAQLSTRNVRQLLVREYYTNQKARADLRMPQTSLETSILLFFRVSKDC